MYRFRQGWLAKVTTAVFIAAVATIFIRPSPALAEHSFKINNYGDHTISAVYISGVDRDSWGRNLLGDYYIAPGHYQTFTIREGCAEDIRLVYTNDHRSTRRNLDTCRYNLDSNY